MPLALRNGLEKAEVVGVQIGFAGNQADQVFVLAIVVEDPRPLDSPALVDEIL